MDELKNEIKDVIISSLQLEDVTREDIVDSEPLFGEGLGLDSIDALELGVALKKKFGARVHVHPLDAPMLLTAEAAQMNEPVCRLPFEAVEADALYPEGERFEITVCGMLFEGMHTPGHTPGGVVLILPEADAAFTGDTIFAHGYGRYDFPGGNLHQLMKSLRAVLALPRSLTIYSGHGGADTMANIAARWNVR